MVWSVSTARMFERCQRQWFYATKIASARARDHVRQRAYRLSKLQSVSGWRGSVVDQVLSNDVIPAIGRGVSVSKDVAISSAMRTFDRQLDIARQHRIMDADVRPSSRRGELIALHCLEYQGEVDEDEIGRARDEVASAIEAFFEMDDLIARLRRADRLISQRLISFEHSKVTVRAVPDVIAFFRTDPPAIIDWKVHAFGWRDAWLQLAVYACALERCNPHKDFPVTSHTFDATDVDLLEVQLLSRTVRSHQLEDEHFSRAEAYIAQSAEAMNLAAGAFHSAATSLDPFQYPVTYYPETCQRCVYRSLCWEEGEQ